MSPCRIGHSDAFRCPDCEPERQALGSRNVVPSQMAEHYQAGRLRIDLREAPSQRLLRAVLHGDWWALAAFGALVFFAVLIFLWWSD